MSASDARWDQLARSRDESGRADADTERAERAGIENERPELAVAADACRPKSDREALRSAQPKSAVTAAPSRPAAPAVTRRRELTSMRRGGGIPEHGRLRCSRAGHATSSSPPRGGALVAALLLTREQAKRHEVGVVCHSSGPAADQFRETGAEVWTLPVDRGIQPMRDLVHLQRLRRIVRRFQPDVLHAHSSKAGVLGRIAARLDGVPVVLSPQNFAYRAYEGSQAARLAFYVIERALAPLTDCLHVVSRDEYADAVRNRMAPSSRCGMVHNGIDLAPLLEMTEHTEESPVTVGTYARMFAQKRIDFLIDALAILAQRGVPFQALVIGDGPERERLLAHAAQRGISASIEFDSTSHDAAASLDRIDVFALSSSHEACPLSVMEAMAAGRPVVATDVGAVSEVVTDGESGLVTPFGATEEYADALERVITDGRLREALGTAARRKAAPRFGAEVMARRMDLLYDCAREHSR